MNAEGARLAAQGEIPTIDELWHLSKHAAEKAKEYQEAEKLTKEQVIEAFDIIKSINGSYAHFDNGYLDGAFEAAKTNEMARENVKKIEAFKNKFREEINKIFFDVNGIFPVVVNRLIRQFSIDIHWYTSIEVLQLFNNQRVSEERLEWRKNAFVFYKHNRVTFLEGQDAKEFIAQFGETPVDKDLAIIKGKTAHKTGITVKARVKVIDTDYGDIEKLNQQMDEMEKGTVLVSQTTAPELMEAIKKASAIITDIGGMLSHAAITARELNIPCIVETGFASKVLNDGDLVEVDADNGIVKIL